MSTPRQRSRTVTLPEISGLVTVSFKHEGETRGMAVGPVIVVDHKPYDAWLKANVAPGSIGIPFGAKPDGFHALGWMTKRQALKVAEHYGVTLEER